MQHLDASRDRGDFVLIVHEDLWMPQQVDHSLWNPNQLRAGGSNVQDNAWIGQMILVDPESLVSIPMKFLRASPPKMNLTIVGTSRSTLSIHGNLTSSRRKCQLAIESATEFRRSPFKMMTQNLWLQMTTWVSWACDLQPANLY